jgi:hypothetical protein
MEQLNFYPFDFLKVILAGSVAMRALTNAVAEHDPKIRYGNDKNISYSKTKF